MTTEIEKRFFKTFGIEAQAKAHEVREGLIECNLVYPEITAEKLLELIVILQNFVDIDFTALYFQNVECLKIEILNQLMNFCNNEIKPQVKALFEE